MYADMTTDWRSILGGDITGLISGGWEPLSKEPTKETFWDPTPPVAVVPGAPFRPAASAASSWSCSRWSG